MKPQESITTLLSRLKSAPQHFTNKVNITDVFVKDNYIDRSLFYGIYFNRVHNLVHEMDIDCHRAIRWFCKMYGQDITDHYFTKLYIKEKKKITVDDVYLVLYDDVLIHFDTNQEKVRFLFKITPIPQIEDMAAGIRKFKKSAKLNSAKISLLYKNSFGFDTKTLNVKRPQLNIADNYNDDFLPVHQIIKTRLNQKNSNGLVLLHGLPGTGKTSYVRYLSSVVRKKIIFLPVEMAKQIIGPDLVPFLVANANSVFVIEDPESLIVDRVHNNDPSVSTLLNLCDGLLSDCLNIQVICSFNIDISKVDKALIRKGRLIALYEFKELSVTKAQHLSDKLGCDTRITQPVTLAEIYNQDKAEYSTPRMKVVGFFN